MIDRTEAANCGLHDLFSCCSLANVPIDEREAFRSHEAGRGRIPRGCNHVVAATEKRDHDRLANPARCPGHNDCLFACQVSRSWFRLVEIWGVPEPLTAGDPAINACGYRC